VSSSVNDYNARLIEEFRANDGTAHEFGNMTLLLLHHTGAKSGERRINPVAYLPDGERYVVFASKGGAPTNPAWYHNLKAHPDATIEVGDRTLPVVASEAVGSEREALFAAQVERAPQFGEYQAKTDRAIPVMILTPGS
jgi:deazaflavin-dependent oxidoreductase (nitroreductase family)